MATPITSTAIREATRAKVASVLPVGTLILTGIGRRDDALIAAQGQFRYVDAQGDFHTMWVVAILDGATVCDITWASSEAQSDVDFMRAAMPTGDRVPSLLR